MKKTVMFCLVLSTVLLAACQQTKKATAQSSKSAESSIAVTKESSSKASSESSTTNSTTSSSTSSTTTNSTSSTDTSSSTATETTTVSNLLWSADKSNQLASFMASWGQTMGQSYQAYGPGNNVNLYGLQLPDGVLNHMNGWQATVANTPISLTWSENGEVPSGYGLVAVYSDTQTQSGQKTRHVYFFTIEGGTPKVLVTSQNQGNPNNYLELRETDNQELKNGFSQIVTGQ
ncbi:DUF4767 domain-containing protein [Enterococcus durans]|uniref:DUF4767 domain-containing protein n=1 Tax=Enterococcus durans TaxID=53345 RepID=UPI00207464DD|nr:DUF4767 domain-containing protein [Enterococcus durans]MCM6855542.1 DUF4767 domain-containing protein [Enterococcus durans]